MPSVALVLPPREAFTATAAGAIALVVRSHARHGAWPCTVLGRAVAAPFAGVSFRPVTPEAWPATGIWPATEAIRYAAAVARALRTVRPDLIEVHNRPDMALYLARRFPAVSLFLHNDPRGMRAARSAAERQRLRGRLAGIFAVSTWVAERFGPGVTVLPNPLEIGDLPPPAPASARNPVILFAGRVVVDKGADVFVDAAGLALPRLPGWTATMIGADRFGPDGPDTPFLRALRPRAAAAGVTMEGYRPHADVLRAMAVAALVVAPGRWPEPFGLVPLEAMASGAALIFAPMGGLPEVVGAAGLAVPAEAAAVAAAIEALAGDPDHRAALAAAGRTRAQAFAAAAVAVRLDAHRVALLRTWSPGRPAPI